MMTISLKKSSIVSADFCFRFHFYFYQAMAIIGFEYENYDIRLVSDSSTEWSEKNFIMASKDQQINQLMDMGFGNNRVVRALQATQFKVAQFRFEKRRILLF